MQVFNLLRHVQSQHKNEKREVGFTETNPIPYLARHF